MLLRRLFFIFALLLSTANAQNNVFSRYPGEHQQSLKTDVTAMVKPNDADFYSETQQKEFVKRIKSEELGKTICMDPSALPRLVHIYLGKNNRVHISSKKFLEALRAERPCPFAPNRKELRKASRKDIVGEWIYPKASQKLRKGKSKADSELQGAQNNQCYAKVNSVVYYRSGKAQHVSYHINRDCFFESILKMPDISSWKMKGSGHMLVKRTDVPGLVEEWSVFIVISPFEFAGIDFGLGDLLAYRSQGESIEAGAASEFRHLQRVVRKKIIKVQ